MRIRKENLKLERIVDERTRELRNVHAQLIRKEKEAMTGKLTKGLVDRILNPMNYINNFAQLTLALIKDLKADVEDLADDATEASAREDSVADAQDIMDMMRVLNSVASALSESSQAMKREAVNVAGQVGQLRDYSQDILSSGSHTSSELSRMSTFAQDASGQSQENVRLVGEVHRLISSFKVG